MDEVAAVSCFLFFFLTLFFLNLSCRPLSRSVCGCRCFSSLSHSRACVSGGGGGGGGRRKERKGGEGGWWLLCAVVLIPLVDPCLPLSQLSIQQPGNVMDTLDLMVKRHPWSNSGNVAYFVGIFPHPSQTFFFQNKHFLWTLPLAALCFPCCSDFWILHCVKHLS